MQWSAVAFVRNATIHFHRLTEQILNLGCVTSKLIPYKEVAHRLSHTICICECSTASKSRGHSYRPYSHFTFCWYTSSSSKTRRTFGRSPSRQRRTRSSPATERLLRLFSVIIAGSFASQLVFIKSNLKWQILIYRRTHFTDTQHYTCINIYNMAC